MGRAGVALLALVAVMLPCTKGFRPTPGTASGVRGDVAMMAKLRRNDRGRTDRPKREVGPLMNGDIKADPLRVVIANAGGADEQLGVISRAEALDKADEAGADLVMISDKADPPVVKIVDYGKFRYGLEKKKKEQLKKSKQNEMKELKMSYKIDVHDYGVRMKNAKKFLTAGSRVRLVVQFKGRENMFHDLGRDLLKKFAAEVEEIGTAEGGPRQEGNRITMIISPKNSK